MSKDWRVKLTEKQKLFVKAVVLFAVSPVYVPAVILWDNRQEFLNFYKEVWTAVTFGDLDG